MNTLGRPTGIKRIWLAVIAASIICLLPLPAKPQETLTITQSGTGEIEITINQRIDNPSDRPPVIRLLEIVQIDPRVQKTFERTFTLVSMSATPGNQFNAKIIPPTPDPGFDHYDVEVSNYMTAASLFPENFRDSALAKITGEIAKASGTSVRVIFKAPKREDMNRLRIWLSAAAAPGAGAVLTAKRTNDTSIQARVIGVSFGNALCPGECVLQANFEIDKSLPVGQELNPVVLSFDASLFEPAKLKDNLALARFRSGISGRAVTDKAVAADEKRDPFRKNVIEVGGGYTNSLNLDPDPVTGKAPQRKTEGFVDLRVAYPPIFLTDDIRKWTTWSPVLFDALISTGKLNANNLSTNTMRLFSQLQYVHTVRRKRDRDYFRLTGEGGAAADRDLRVIEYTGSFDFRYSPALLFRVLTKNPEADLAPTLRVDFMPAGVEIGKRQVRRDPFFLSDDFVRRFRFAEKLELLLPPYLQFVIEDRSWVRGEVTKNRFRNFFQSTLTLFPAGQNENFSAGVFVSYERGSLPPFSTARSSIFKVGFRVRQRNF